MKFRNEPWSHDYRSKRFTTKALGFAAIPLLPPSLYRKRYECLDQGDTLRCAVYAAVMNGQYIHGLNFSLDWQKNKIDRLQGKDVDEGGSNPNDAMNSQVFSKRGGYLPINLWNGTAPSLLDSYAINYSDEGYVKPASGKDAFDSICTELHRHYDPKTGLGACVQMFTAWYDGFNAAEIRAVTRILGYHSYLAIDFDRNDPDSNNHFLWLQNSYGNRIGYNGYHKIYRPAVNDLLSRWGNSCKIPAPLTATQIAMAKEETPIGALQRQIINIFYQITLYLIAKYGTIKPLWTN